MFQIADFVANAMLDAWEAAFGAAPILRFRTGPPPANLAAASSGVVVAELVLPADWMGAAAARAKAMAGVWQDLAADNGGTIAHYEIVKADGVTRCEQGTVTATGGGGDIEVQNTVVVAGQKVSVTAFNRSMPNNA